MSSQISILPDYAVVGQIGTWRITYTPPGLLCAGDVLTLRPGYHSQLKFRWQAADPASPNYVRAECPPDVGFHSDISRGELRITITDGEIKPGDQIAIVLGEGQGFEIWPVAHDLEFALDLPAIDERRHFKIPVHADAARKLLVKNPSVVKAHEEATLLIRAVDQHGNTARDFRGTLAVNAEGLTGLPAYIEFVGTDRGIRRIAAQTPEAGGRAPVRVSVADGASGVAGVGSPMEVVDEHSCERIFWGDLHCHSSLAQALEPPEFLYAYAQHEEALDFICHTEHDAGTNSRWVGERWRDWKPPVNCLREYIEAIWDYRKHLVRKHYEPGKFVTFLGYEWASNLYGHMNVYYATDDAPIFYPEDFWQESFTPAALWDRLGDLEAFTVPHHPSHRIRSQPGGFVSGWDWDFYDERRVPLVEIYSKHGNSEHFGCPRSIADQVPEGCVQAALARGYKIGFIANTDTHASRPGSDLSGDLYVRQGGLTAVFAPCLERRAIFEALRCRRCYGTSGQRIIVRFWVNDAFMGEEVALDDPNLRKSVRIQIAGTAPLAQVCVVKNNQVMYETSGPQGSLAAEYIDRSRTAGTDSYYLRVVQEDGEMAWASPVWVSVL